jgi:hypothetical protein
MKQYSHLALTVICTAFLSACGGGGGTTTPSTGGSSGGSGAGTETGGGAGGGTLASSQSVAGQSVADINAGVATFKKADSAKNAPGGGAIGALTTLNCSTYGGTGSIGIDYDASGSSTITYNACTIAGSTLNGTISTAISGTPGVAGSTVTQTYNNFTISYAGAPAETITGSTTCTYGSTAGSFTCSQSVNGYAVSNVSISSSGTRTTVNAGRLVGATSYGNATCDYTGWVFDSSTGRATAGTAVLDYGNGNRIEITASAASYTVKITYNGTVNTYTVS